MSSDQPTAADLMKESSRRSDQRKKIYSTILEAVYTRIKNKAKMGWTRIVYSVPGFVVGLPPYDTRECAAFVAKRLKKKGFKIDLFNSVVLYISWDPSEM